MANASENDMEGDESAMQPLSSVEAMAEAAVGDADKVIVDAKAFVSLCEQCAEGSMLRNFAAAYKNRTKPLTIGRMTLSSLLTSTGHQLPER